MRTAALTLLAALLPRGRSFAPAVSAAAAPSSDRATARRKWVRSPLLAAADAVAAPAGQREASPFSTLPTWEELGDALADRDHRDEEQPPLVTLYRDTNGWCPFCERVWVALRAKNVPYAEQLVSLQDKPEWYKALVPTALVPAVLFHGDDGGEGEEGQGRKNERRIVWESMDVLRALDEAFPDWPPRLIRDTPEFDEALSMNDDLSAAGFAYVYADRNGTLTDDEKEERRAKFSAELDRLDRALEEGGPFRLGEEFTGLDAIMVPTLERWRYQLPVTSGVDVLEGRAGLARWFRAMESYEPYADRVAGDEYSWTAAASMFLRYFGGGEDRPDVADAIARADAAAERLAHGFAEGLEDVEDGASFAAEAARKLIANHDAVVEDCTRSDPISQQHMPRAADSEAADAVLRYVASVMVSSSSPSPSSSGESVLEVAKSSPVLGISSEKAKPAAVAARAVSSRLCVPRDMSAPAAKILRGVLVTVAERLEERG